MHHQLLYVALSGQHSAASEEQHNIKLEKCTPIHKGVSMLALASLGLELNTYYQIYNRLQHTTMATSSKMVHYKRA